MVVMSIVYSLNFIFFLVFVIFYYQSFLCVDEEFIIFLSMWSWVFIFFISLYKFIVVFLINFEDKVFGNVFYIIKRRENLSFSIQMQYNLFFNLSIQLSNLINKFIFEMEYLLFYLKKKLKQQFFLFFELSLVIAAFFTNKFNFFFLSFTEFVINKIVFFYLIYFYYDFCKVFFKKYFYLLNNFSYRTFQKNKSRDDFLKNMAAFNYSEFGLASFNVFDILKVSNFMDKLVFLAFSNCSFLLFSCKHISLSKELFVEKENFESLNFSSNYLDNFYFGGGVNFETFFLSRSLDLGMLQNYVYNSNVNFFFNLKLQTKNKKINIFWNFFYKLFRKFNAFFMLRFNKIMSTFAFTNLFIICNYNNLRINTFGTKKKYYGIPFLKSHLKKE